MKQLSPQELVQLKAQHENWMRIYNDSHKIIQNTLNIDTLKGRIDTIREFMNWVFDMREQGYPLTVNQTREAALSELDRVYNHHILRIAMDITNKASTPEQSAKAVNTLKSLTAMLVDASNKDECIEEIDIELTILNSKL